MHPETVAGPDGEEPEGGDGGEDDLTLLSLRRAEVEAGRAVGDDERLELPVGFGGPDVGNERSSGEDQSIRRASSPGP